MTQELKTIRLRTFWRNLPFGERDLVWIITSPTSRAPLDGCQYKSRATAVAAATEQNWTIAD